MEIKSIIAQVDDCTEQIMSSISNEIKDAIDEDVQRIKKDTKDIASISEQTEEIMEKLNEFDGLSTSLADLKEVAAASKTLANIASPMESKLNQIRESIDKGLTTKLDTVEQTLSNQTKECNRGLVEGIASVQSALNENNTKNAEREEQIKKLESHLKNIEDSTQTGFQSSLNRFSEIAEIQKKDNNATNASLEKLTAMFSASHLEDIEKIEQLVALISSVSEQQTQNRDLIDEKLLKLHSLLTDNHDRFLAEAEDLRNQQKALRSDLMQKTEYLDQQISLFAKNYTEHMTAQNQQIAYLVESLEKIQVTLDIIVNLTTPFWKKWKK